MSTSGNGGSAGNGSGNQDVVLQERRDGVAILTLNRPERMNAWTGEMESRYFGLLDEAAADPDVRVIVVTGAGRAFCAGADMDMLQGIGASDGRSLDARGDRAPRSQTDTLKVPKPVIAAINGACAGIGLVQALMCDLRFAAAGAKFTTAFARRGLVAEYGLSWVLPRLMGPARALDVLLSARVLLAEEALELGMVNRVLDPANLLEETLAYAADLAANCSPSSMATIKGQVWGHLDADLAGALEETDGLMRSSLAAADFKEGVASFMEKRPPQFAPLAR